MIPYDNPNGPSLFPPEPNRFAPENRFIGDVEDGKRYPLGCYTKEETYSKEEVDAALTGKVDADTFDTALADKLDVDVYDSKMLQIDSDLQKIETLADIDNSLIPYYKGDLYMEYQFVPSSFYFNGDHLYILCFSRVSNTGRVYKINFTTNTIVDKFTAKIYHANSCATCNNKVFIAKGASQVEGESASGIIIADTSLQNMHTIGSDIGTFQSVSYDEVTNKLYAYRNNGSLYEINPATESIEFIEQINVPNIGHYNQDFCIRDGIAMISSWYKEFIIVDISTTEVIGSGCMPAETGEKYFILDENEGWEWNNGNLFCVMYSKKRNVDSFCTFTMLGVGQTVISRPSSAIQSGNFTVTINDEARSKFANNEYTFKHPNQLMITTQKFNGIKIDTTENLGDVYLSDSVEILGNLVCDTLVAKCADLTFNPSTGSVVSIGSLQSPNNGGAITFGGNNFEYDIESATFGYSVVMLKIRSGTSFTNPSVFGSQLAVPLKRSITMLSTVPAMVPLQKKATNITIEANGEKTIQVPFSLPNSYWTYRAIAVSENVNIIAACDETRTDEMNATVNVYLSNESSESKTFAVNVFLIPNYNRTGDEDDVIDFSDDGDA